MDAHAKGSVGRTYLKVLIALVCLTVVTVLAAGQDFGAANAVIALLIASVKASLVALFFMHLRHDKPMNAIIFVSGLVFLAVFLILCAIDQGARAPTLHAGVLDFQFTDDSALSRIDADQHRGVAAVGSSAPHVLLRTDLLLDPRS